MVPIVQQDRFVKHPKLSYICNHSKDFTKPMCAYVWHQSRLQHQQSFAVYNELIAQAIGMHSCQTEHKELANEGGKGDCASRYQNLGLIFKKCTLADRPTYRYKLWEYLYKLFKQKSVCKRNQLDFFSLKHVVCKTERQTGFY